MSQPYSHVASALQSLVKTGAYSAVKYLSPEHVVKVTRQHPRADKRGRSTSYLVTIGKPNYAGREFVRACLRAGEPFPVRKVQLKFKAPKHYKK